MKTSSSWQQAAGGWPPSPHHHTPVTVLCLINGIGLRTPYTHVAIAARCGRVCVHRRVSMHQVHTQVHARLYRGVRASCMGAIVAARSSGTGQIASRINTQKHSPAGMGFSSRACCNAVLIFSGVCPPNCTMMPSGRSTCTRCDGDHQQCRHVRAG